MYVKVLVHTEAKTECIKKISEDSYEISTRVPAENNRANRKIIEMLCKFDPEIVGTVRIVSGHHNTHKILDITKKSRK